MKYLKRVLLVLLVSAIVLCAAAVYIPDVISSRVSSAEGSHTLALLRGCYRDSSEVVFATCVVSFTSTNGGSTSRFTVDEVLGGDLVVGQTVSVSESASVGKSYLLYLKNGGGADYAEDESGFATVTDGLVAVSGSNAVYGGESVSLEALTSDISEQSTVLTVPAQSFNYDSLDTLAAAADEIFIGTVVSVSSPEHTLCRSYEKGESVLNTLDVTYVTIRVVNGMGSTLSRGDTVTLALIASRVHSVISATDLTSVSFRSPILQPAEGSSYVFFLEHSADEKSDVFFTVNPYEGYVRLEGNSLIRPYYNAAMKGMYDLRAFVLYLNELLDV